MPDERRRGDGAKRVDLVRVDVGGRVSERVIFAGYVPTLGVLTGQERVARIWVGGAAGVAK